MVSNAAANPVFGPILQTPEEGWDKIFDVNVKSAFLLAKDIIPLMEKKGLVLPFNDLIDILGCYYRAVGLYV